ncbi:MAG: hypothetical protein ACRD96_27810 [Bryobacteraceae bacterium]
MQSAWKTRGYRRRLEAAGLTDELAMEGVDSIDLTLARIPYLAEAEWRSRPNDYLNPRARNGRPRLQYPAGVTPRVALVGADFETTRNVESFDAGDTARLIRFEPQALAAPVDVLLRMSASGLPRLSHALIAFTGIERTRVDEADRDALWRAFRVPLFEQFVGLDGELIAYECEAHHGLHLVADNAVVERNGGPALLLTSLTDCRRPLLRLAIPLAGRIECAPCDCGLAGRRLFTRPR